MKAALPIVTAITTSLFLSSAYSAESLETYSAESLESWDENGDGEVSLNEWDRNFEEKDVFFRLKERQEESSADRSEDAEYEYALPHLEEGYSANVSVELFTSFDLDESGVLEEDEFGGFAALLSKDS